MESTNQGKVNFVKEGSISVKSKSRNNRKLMVVQTAASQLFWNDITSFKFRSR